MLRRFWIHVGMIVLFACVQMGIAAHEISHLKQLTQHSQPDKNTANEQCGQCIAYAQSAHGIGTSNLDIPLSTAQFQLPIFYAAKLESVLNTPYRARAPPATSLI